MRRTTLADCTSVDPWPASATVCCLLMTRPPQSSSYPLSYPWTAEGFASLIDDVKARSIYGEFFFSPIVDKNPVLAIVQFATNASRANGSVNSSSTISAPPSTRSPVGVSSTTAPPPQPPNAARIEFFYDFLQREFPRFAIHSAPALGIIKKYIQAVGLFEESNSRMVSQMLHHVVLASAAYFPMEDHTARTSSKR